MIQTWTLVAQLVLLAAYVIGVLIINKTLRAQVKSQGDIMSRMEQYSNIIKLDEIQKYVEMSAKTVLMESEEKLKKQDEEWKKKANGGVRVVLDEFLALLDFSLKVTGDFATNPKYLEHLHNMKDSLSKTRLLLFQERVWQQIIKLANDNPTLLALLIRSDYFQGAKKAQESPENK
jgi:hypothetical protein